MVYCFVDFLKCILCCEDEKYDDPDGYRYRDRDNSYVRIQDQRNFHYDFFSRSVESDSRSSIASTGSNFTTKIPAKASVSPSTSTNFYEVFKPSTVSGASSTSSGAKPKLSEPPRPRVTVLPPPASCKPTNESVSKLSYTKSPSIPSREQASAQKPPPVTSSATSSSLKLPPVVSSTSKPKLSEPPRPSVIVLPPPASSKPPIKPLSKPSYTQSPSIPSREQAPSPKPPTFTSSATSSSLKLPPVVSSTSKSKSFPRSSSFDFREGDSEPLKEILRRVSSKGNETTYAQKDTSPIYMIPKEIQNIIERGEVPEILESPLTPLTYKDYFATLLYAEDVYIEEWSKFELKDVSLKLEKASVQKPSEDRNRDAKYVKDNRIFVIFEIDSVPGRRPFLLSRDFVFAKPVGKQDRKFQGIINRVRKSTQVLVKFEEGFYAQYNPKSRYDISFSFNRVCLKRAHQALEAALQPSFANFLFPMYRSDYSQRSPFSQSSNTLELDQQSAIRHILGLKGSPPYLVEGPFIQCSELSNIGVLVREAALEIYRTVKNGRILVSAPRNSTCDDLIISLMKDIPESEMFRANAAFRGIDEVPEDVISFCQYRNDCFTCPSLQKLKEFRVVFSTFVSGFRLHHAGLKAGHFSHIFLVDASLAIEPEVMITLANFADDDTSVIVTGSSSTRSRWVRSDLAWMYGLGKSYYQRLRDLSIQNTRPSIYHTKIGS